MCKYDNVVNFVILFCMSVSYDSIEDKIAYKTKCYIALHLCYIRGGFERCLRR
nr:MAG TPA: hypothetical protein [Caudoviricetes sp.]